MSYTNISVQQLEYIVAVDQYRHYVTAAEKSFVSQPNLSMQIKKLEDQLEVVLFDRSKQPIVPTAIGEQVIEQARKVLNHLHGIDEMVKQHKGEIKGELIVGIIPTLAPYLVPLFVGDFLQTYPDVKVTIKEMLTEEIVSALKKEIIDLGLIVTPVDEKGINKQVLFYEEILLFKNESLKSKEIKLQDLKHEKFWLLKEGHCFRNQMVNLCAPQITDLDQFQYESGSLEGLKNLVLKEGGSTLLPELAVSNLSDTERKKVVPIVNNKPFREVSLIQSRMKLKEKLVQVLANQIVQSVPSRMHTPKGNIIRWK